MARQSRRKPGAHRLNAVQMCLFDAQLSLEAVEQALAMIAKVAVNPRVVAEAHRIIRERRRQLAIHNANLAQLLEAV